MASRIIHRSKTSFDFSKGEPKIPERIILLDATGSISFDVLSWLAEQDVPLIRINWRGDIVCIASKSGYSANPYRVQWQRELRENANSRLEYSIRLITDKIENSIRTLEKSILRNDAWNRAVEAAYSALTNLDARQPKSIVELRALEANAAAAYFRAWKGMPIRWRDTNRRPIPDNWRYIIRRISYSNKYGNRNASHPLNAMLNYAYTVLQSHLQIQAIADGYDPTIGIMHEGGAGAPAFIFDLMEPHRRRLIGKFSNLSEGMFSMRLISRFERMGSVG